MYKKKISTIAIVTILTLSILIAAIPMASALTADPKLYETPLPGFPVTTEKVAGAVGSRISVIGNTTFANNASAYSLVTAYWISQSGIVLGTASADGAGGYRIDVVIPSATAGVHEIVVNDGGIGGAQGVDFTVEPSVSVSTTPSTKDDTYNAKVLPGDALTVVGHGFAGGAFGSQMNITLEGPAGTIVITTPSVTTNSTGSFSAVITIPTILVTAYGAYSVNGTDASDNWAIAPILIDYYNTVTPNQGPSGVTITISGRIPANMAYTLLIDTTNIGSGTSGADGVFTNTYNIPDLIAVTAHTIYVRWVVGTDVITRAVTFTVTAAPVISYLSTASGVAGAVITISGTGFSPSAKITVTLGTTIANSTDLDARFGPTNFFGAFTNEQFTVPAITAGIYTIKVTDQYGAATNGTLTFTVLPTPGTTIALRASSYYTGDTLSFNIRTTEGSLSSFVVTIYDPSSFAQWTINNWVPAGTPTKIVPIMSQVDDTNKNPLTLPADAPLGTWNWTITYIATSTSPATTKATGLFTVAALPTMQTVLDQLDAMEATITNVITTTEGDIIAVINTKTGTITTKLDPLMPKLQAIEDTAVIIATMLGEVQVDIAALDLAALDALGVDITAIKGDVATIKTNIGTVTASVSALDAKVTSLSGDVATVSTTLGTLEGTVTSIDGKVATIDTDVGTLQADISDVSSKVDTTPAWIAVVLSLIAAIAAIFAVITIRQKIAG